MYMKTSHFRDSLRSLHKEKLVGNLTYNEIYQFVSVILTQTYETENCQADFDGFNLDRWVETN